MLAEYDVIRLKRTAQAISLAVGTTGTILIVHDANPPAFEVEAINLPKQVIQCLKNLTWLH